MRTYALSYSIQIKTPPAKRSGTVADLQWIAKNVSLTNLERAELHALLDYIKRGD